jgi:hypothetical protein
MARDVTQALLQNNRCISGQGGVEMRFAGVPPAHPASHRELLTPAGPLRQAAGLRRGGIPAGECRALAFGILNLPSSVCCAMAEQGRKGRSGLRACHRAPRAARRLQPLACKAAGDMALTASPSSTPSPPFPCPQLLRGVMLRRSKASVAGQLALPPCVREDLRVTLGVAERCAGRLVGRSAGGEGQGCARRAQRQRWSGVGRPRLRLYHVPNA